MLSPPLVLKVGGNDLDDDGFVSTLAALVVAQARPIVIVHGGGKGTSALSEKLGLTPRFLDGLRVTDEAALEVAVMGLVGAASVRLSGALSGAGVKALGLCGADAGLVRVERMRHPAGDLGRVGRPVAVDAEAIGKLLAAGFVPCIAPICAGDDGLYNVNADAVAQAVAAALGADALVFLTNVRGVRIDGEHVPHLTPADIEDGIAGGHIVGGMIPKVRSAVEALDTGVRRVLITDLEGVAGWLDGRPGGTEIAHTEAGSGLCPFPPPARVGLCPPSTRELSLQSSVTKGEARPAALGKTREPGGSAHNLPASGNGGSTMHESIHLEQQHLAPTYKRAAMVLERGEGVTLWDTDGREYIDFLAGIAVNVLGYADPDVTRVLRESADGLIHVSNLYHTLPHAQLARDLCQASFADRVFFCNSGTEANEAAIKFARKRARAADPERVEIVAFSSAFHGRTMGALAVTHNAKYREPFEPLIGGVRWATFDDLDSARGAIGPKTAAVIVEPVQGEGGVKPASPGFLEGLRALCSENGASLIFDEVQCGLGRTGTLWAHEPYGVTPDLMTLAKPLGGGLPIGAVLMTEAVASSLAPGDHGSTFAGGPLVTRVARAVLGKVAGDGFLAHVRDVGAYLGARLNELRSRPEVLDVRGLGLMWGVQLDPSVTAGDVVTAGHAQGLIIGSAGDNTLRFVPPLIVRREHVDAMIERLQKALDAVLPAAEVAACP